MCISQYREKILQFNRTILDREIALQNIDKHSTEEEDIAEILEELWGGCDGWDAVRRDVHKVSDFYKHIPDGTLPVEDQDFQTGLFEKLELSLNQVLVEKHRPVAIPEEFKILATLTGGIIGPGFPSLQVTTIVSALVPNNDEAKGPEELETSTGLLTEDRWELLVGFECGYSEHGGSAHIVYGRCTDPAERLENFQWIYVITYAFYDIHCYGSFFEYLNAYADEYADLCNTWR